MEIHIENFCNAIFADVRHLKRIKSNFKYIHCLYLSILAGVVVGLVPISSVYLDVVYTLDRLPVHRRATKKPHRTYKYVYTLRKVMILD